VEIIDWLLSHAVGIVIAVLLWRILGTLVVLRDSRVTPQTLDDYYSRFAAAQAANHDGGEVASRDGGEAR
jgi:hypothetical protein